jgi:hypothetical protein
MTTEILQKKTGRYLRGQSLPAETKQIQSWLSCTTDKKAGISADEKERIENEIVASIQAYVTWSIVEPKSGSLWKKITTFF